MKPAMETFSASSKAVTTRDPAFFDFRGRWRCVLGALISSKSMECRVVACLDEIWRELEEHESLPYLGPKMRLFRFYGRDREGVEHALDEMESKVSKDSDEGIQLAAEWYRTKSEENPDSYQLMRVLGHCVPMSRLTLPVMEYLYPDVAWQIISSEAYPRGIRTDKGHAAVVDSEYLYLADYNMRGEKDFGFSLHPHAWQIIRATNPSLARYLMLLAGAPLLDGEREPWGGKQRDAVESSMKHKCCMYGIDQEYWLALLEPKQWKYFMDPYGFGIS
jgi:hypothetical protein